ncbi:hypothetical protein CA563_08540 [Campylobacter coli]|nr:hypothetical protein [Campylobacter coli]EAI6471231.1 hypothetical protein [Campylobacter coli]
MELTRPFAENGDRQDFPVDTQGDGSMSLQQGFGAFYGLPPEEGGLFIQRPQFNQLMYLVSKGVIDNKTAIETLKSEYGSLSTSSAKLLTENLTWTVGSGGDYENLTDALNEASKYKNAYLFNINIILKSGYNITKGINFNNGDYSYITLSSEDDIVNYTGSDETFINITNFSKSPIINAKFSGGGGAAGKDGCIIKSGSLFINSGKGFLNFLDGIVVESGFVYGIGAVCSGMGKQCLYANGNGFINFKNGDLSNYNRKVGALSHHNIYCGYGSMIDISNCNLSNSKDLCINGNGGYVMANSLNMTGCTYTTGYFINCYGGSIINTIGTSTSISGGGSFSNIALNNFIKNGIVLN